MKPWAVILHIDAEDDYTKADLIDAMAPTFLPHGVQLADIEVMEDKGVAQ